MGVETPTDPVVLASVLLGGDFSVDLVHGFDNHADVVGFRQGREGRSDRGGVTGKQSARTGTVDVVSGVANGSNSRQVCGAATSEDGLLNVFPESGLVKELKDHVSYGQRGRGHDVLTETLHA